MLSTAIRLLSAQPPNVAFAAFEAARRGRVARVVKASQSNARNYHLSGPMRFGVHGLLRSVGSIAPGLFTRTLDWIFSYDATREFPDAQTQDTDV